MKNSEKTPISNYLEWSREGKSAIWRYVVAIILIFIIWNVGTVAIMQFVFTPLNIDIKTNPIAFYFTFTLAFLAVPLTVRYLLGRPAHSVALLSWPPKLADFGLAILIQWIALVIVALFSAFVMGSEVRYRGFEQMSASTLFLVVGALVGVFIQTGFEEIYFRGLIQQATYRVTKWLPVVVLVQAVFFASMHTGNIEAFRDSSPYLAAIPYSIVALAWGWVAWRTGSLVMSMGLHFGNNAFLWLFAVTEGDVINGIAPFVFASSSGNLILRSSLSSLGSSILAIIMVEIILRRRATLHAASSNSSTQGNS